LAGPTDLPDTARILATIRLASEYKSDNNPDSARYWARQALQESERVAFSYGVAQAQLELAELYFNLQQYDTALLYFRQLEIYGLQQRDSLFLKGIYSHLGLMHYNQYKYDSAIVYFRLTAELSQSLQLFPDLGPSYFNLGRAQQQAGKTEAAIASFSHAITVFDSLRDGNNLGRIYNSLGILHKNLGQYELSADYYQRGLALAQSEQDSLEIGMMYSNLGVLYKTQGNYRLALDYYFKVLAIQEALRNLEALPGNYNNIGDIYSSQGDYEKALTYFNMSLAIVKEQGNQYKTAFYLNNIGDTYTRLEAWDQALASHREAFEIAKAINNDFLKGWSLIYEGVVHASIGDYEQGMAQIEAGLPYSLKINDTYSLIPGYISLGVCYRGLNELEKAIAFGEQSVALAEKHEIELYRKALGELHITYQLVGNYRQAYETYVTYKVIEDSIINEENIQRLFATEANYRFQQEKDSIQLVGQAQQLAYEKDLEKKAIQQRATMIGLVLALLLIGLLFLFFRAKSRSNELLQEKSIELEKANQALVQRNEEVTAHREQLQQANHNVEQLTEIGKKIAASQSVQQIERTVYEEIHHLMDSPLFGLGLFREKEKDLFFPAFMEMGNAFQEVSYPLNEPQWPAVLCFNEQKLLHFGDYELEGPSVLGALPSPKFGVSPNSMLYIPITKDQKRIGVFTLQSFQKNAYQGIHLTLLKNLASYIAIALDNAAAYQQIQTQAKEIQQMNLLLEQKVAHRTQVLEEQNQKLTEFAYLNAHKVRRPLAGILGLLSLMESVDTPDASSYLEKLRESALELDTVVHQINQLVSLPEEDSQHEDFVL